MGGLFQTAWLEMESGQCSTGGEMVAEKRLVLGPFEGP